MAKKNRLIEKKYSFCKSMVYAIQAITGEKTHDILGTLVGKGDEVFANNGIDITKKFKYGYFCEKKARDYMFYPNTKLYLGIYVSVVVRQINPNTWNGKLKNVVTYSFKLPQSYVKMNNKQYDDMVIDGMLTNSSFDFELPTIKRPKILIEKDEKQIKGLQKIADLFNKTDSI